MKRSTKNCIGTIVLVVLLIAAVLAIVGLCTNVFDGLAGKTHTVTFDLGTYEGKETVEPVTVKNGKEVEFPEAPAWKDYTFQGWVIDDDIYLAGESRTVTKDITAKAKYVLSSDVDSRDWYIIGDGFGSLNSVGWRHDHGIKLTRGVSAKEGCVTAYRSTVNIYAGDDFKITYGGSWDNAQFTRNDVWLGWKYFEEDPGDGNIRLSKGEDGVYNVTLYIFSKDVDTHDHLEIEKVKDLAPQPEYAVTLMAGHDLTDTDYASTYPEGVMATFNVSGYFVLPSIDSYAILDGFNFTGWKVGEQIYKAGDRIRVTGATTVTAQWAAIDS